MKIQNIIKIYEAQKIISIDKVKEIPREIFEVMPLTVGALKGYIANKKLFENFVNDGIISKKHYTSGFKLCFVLGLFSKPDEQTISFIKQILKEKGNNYVSYMFFDVKLESFNEK